MSNGFLHKQNMILPKVVSRDETNPIIFVLIYLMVNFSLLFLTSFGFVKQRNLLITSRSNLHYLPIYTQENKDKRESLLPVKLM